MLGAEYLTLFGNFGTERWQFTKERSKAQLLWRKETRSYSDFQDVKSINKRGGGERRGRVVCLFSLNTVKTSSTS